MDCPACRRTKEEHNDVFCAYRAVEGGWVLGARLPGERKVAVIRYTKDNRDHIVYVPVAIPRDQTLRVARDEVMKHVIRSFQAPATWIAWVDSVQVGKEFQVPKP